MSLLKKDVTPVLNQIRGTDFRFESNMNNLKTYLEGQVDFLKKNASPDEKAFVNDIYRAITTGTPYERTQAAQKRVQKGVTSSKAANGDLI